MANLPLASGNSSTRMECHQSSYCNIRSVCRSGDINGESTCKALFGLCSGEFRIQWWHMQLLHGPIYRSLVAETLACHLRGYTQPLSSRSKASAIRTSPRRSYYGVLDAVRCLTRTVLLDSCGRGA